MTVPEWLRPAAYGFVAGAIAISTFGFAWGGWVTGATSRKLAETVAGDAVAGRLAEICIVQFNQDPGKDQKLEELKKAGSYQRRTYVQDQGWATMPGEEKPDSKVADACAKLLVQIGQ